MFLYTIDMQQISTQRHQRALHRRTERLTPNLPSTATLRPAQTAPNINRRRRKAAVHAATDIQPVLNASAPAQRPIAPPEHSSWLQRVVAALLRRRLRERCRRRRCLLSHELKGEVEMQRDRLAVSAERDGDFGRRGSKGSGEGGGSRERGKGSGRGRGRL
ncbi:hypothetical protein BCR35DRAFT_306280 [Leucosporidium creatinivorum]|uniref:Uncharacterized protein n=1 Tax=Leucosporidium creatinivorum TaxID=106004 RepID=A0A1Y2EUR0_9BASI|nr:hypothetical protein BCR35DRAFT_306280 [Leucosporidium creatinivorum]